MSDKKELDVLVAELERMMESDGCIKCFCGAWRVQGIACACLRELVEDE